VKIFADGLFKDKVAIVTGGGAGIGLAIARELGSLGAKVAISGRNLEKLDAAVTDLRGMGIEVMSGACDIRKVDEINVFIEAVLKQYGRIDILINNAGGQFPSPAEMISPNGFFAVVNNNLNGTWNMTHAVATKWMIENGGGRICTIVANMWKGFPGMVHTGAARAGVVNMTKTLGTEWARHKINVTAVAPGTIQSTGMKQYPPELVATSRHAIPAKRLGSEEEIAWATAFMVSPAADFITGETLSIDGGAQNWGDIWEIPDHVGGDETAMKITASYRDLRRTD
jgi:citronellol/citronellal dehydrogenase